ncbi:MAG: hypothetical protein WEB00_11555 [Dehalococcoidia bacterium]
MRPPSGTTFTVDGNLVVAPGSDLTPLHLVVEGDSLTIPPPPAPPFCVPVTDSPAECAGDEVAADLTPD